MMMMMLMILMLSRVKGMMLNCVLPLFLEWHPTNRCWILIYRFHWGNWILSHQNYCAGETRNFGLQTFKKKFLVFILSKEISCVHYWHFARSDFLSVWRRLEDTTLRSPERRGWSSRCFVINIMLRWIYVCEYFFLDFLDWNSYSRAKWIRMRSARLSKRRASREAKTWRPSSQIWPAIRRGGCYYI